MNQKSFRRNDRHNDKLLRIGAGASFADDRIAPAVELA